MNNKSYLRWNKNSIAFKFMILFIVLIIAQSVLFVTTMIIAGVLKEAKDSAFQSFDEQVNNQKDSLEKEMSNRWTNIDSYLKELSKKAPQENTVSSNKQFLEQATPTLISMLRTTMTTGVFIILDNKMPNKDQHLGLYLRDYDPLLNDETNKDLYAIVGPPDISKKYKIPLDANWSSQLKLTENNRAFFDKPYLKADLSTNPKLLGYWSKPFQLTADDQPIITYSVPFFDSNNKLRGIIGIEILIDNFNQFLPGKDLLARDSLGFLIGYKDEKDSAIFPLITNGALQNRILNIKEPFKLSKADKKRGIFLVENHNNKDSIYASVQKINLYYSNTPFENEEWYLIGLTEDNRLLSLVNKIQSILLFSFIVSILVGAIGVYVIGYIFTKPIIQLAKQVRESDIEKGTTLSKTGLLEIDELSHAIETANQNLIESTVKISQIIDLVNVPIGAFEYKEHDEKVFMTDQLKTLLQFNNTESEQFHLNKQQFIHRLDQIMSNAEPGEDCIYKISSSPDRWVRINTIIDQTSTLGIVIDVTGEIQEKMLIKLERDYDALTKIYNRGAFKYHVTQLLSKNELGCAACIMFDLDLLKLVNDTYGHKWGDIYISTTANYLSTFNENGSVISRLSGDEFAVFLYNFDSKDQIRNLVKQFYETLAQNPILFPDGERQIRISGGLYWLDTPNEIYDYDQIMQTADEMLYKAKKTAKGTLQEYV